MHVPDHFAETRLDELHRIMREHPFGLLVTHTGAGLGADHLPFVLDVDRGAFGTLIFHVARANPVWRALDDGDPALVVFRGAHGYISANWYASRHDTPEQAPTWNYQAVHAHGRVRIFDDPSKAHGMVARLVRQQESAQPQPWKLSDAPPDYVDGELAHVVGMEIEITRLQGQQKLSQNKDGRDFASAMAALEARGETGLASEMKRARDLGK